MENKRRKYKAWACITFLILFGCVPATLMAYFAVPLALSGVFGFIAGDGWLSLGAGAWGLMGVLGTFSLWTISLGFPSPILYIGLLIGTSKSFVRGDKLLIQSY